MKPEQPERNKYFLRNEHGLRILDDNSRNNRLNIYVIRILKQEERQGGTETWLKELMVKTFQICSKHKTTDPVLRKIQNKIIQRNPCQKHMHWKWVTKRETHHLQEQLSKGVLSY